MTKEHFLEHLCSQWFVYDTVSLDLRVIADTPSLAYRKIAANGQFTPDSPQCSATIMTPPQPSGSVTAPREGLGITVFCIVALPRDRLGITAREVNRARLYLTRVMLYAVRINSG